MRKIGLIRHSLIYMDAESFRNLFVSLVHLHLEYCAPVWKLILKKDKIAVLKSVLRRLSKWIPGFTNLSYSDHLKKLCLSSMRYRHECGDMIEVFKILNGYYNTKNDSLNLAMTSTRGNSCKLQKSSIRTMLRQNMFYNRVVNVWNSYLMS